MHGKSLLRTSESSRFLKWASLWCFEEGKKMMESWNFMLNFCTFSVGGCWSQPMLLFWKLVDETQNLKPREPTIHHNSIKFWVLLPIRADLLCTLQCEIPCKFLFLFRIFIGFGFDEKNKIRNGNIYILCNIHKQMLLKIQVYNTKAPAEICTDSFYLYFYLTYSVFCQSVI